MADNEHATPSLGDSEMLAVQHPVAPPVPALGQPAEDGGEITPAVGSKEPWNVLKQQPLGSQELGHPQELPEERTARSGEPGALAGDADVLAGKAAGEEINTAGTCCAWSAVGRVPIPSRPSPPVCQLNANSSYVSMSLDAGPVPGEDAPAEWVDLALPDDLVPGPLQPEPKAADPREELSDPHDGVSSAT